MNTRDIAAEYRLAHWAQIMRERNESRLSIKAFCVKIGIHENTYFYWQRKLREAASEQLIKDSKSTIIGQIRPVFTEVKLQDNLPPVKDTGAELQGALSIAISGVQMIADSAYPVNQLVYLLRELVTQC